MAASSEAPACERHLVVSIDYGTTFVAVSFRITNGDPMAATQATRESELCPLDFKDGAKESPQKVAWDAQGNFIWGHAVSEAVDRGDIRLDRVIEQWKLLLYPDLLTSDLVDRVRKQLRAYNKTLDQLLAQHMKALLSAVKDSIKAGPDRLDYTNEEIEAMPVQLLLSVPQMWKAPGNLRMTKAATAAKAETVELFYEPQSAAAFILQRYVEARSLPAGMRQGDIIVVADSGGGTGDFVAYELLSDASSGAGVKLRPFGDAKGALCGSYIANVMYLKHFTNYVCDNSGSGKSFTQHCTELQRTDVEICKIVDSQFELLKKGLVPGVAGIRWITVPAAAGSNAPPWNIPIRNAEIQMYFQRVIDKNMEQIQALINTHGDKVKSIVTVGGMGKSAFFTNQIRQAFGQNRSVIGATNRNMISSHTVASGAQLRYNDIDTSSLRATGSFGISQEEEVDDWKHRDVVRAGTLYQNEMRRSGRNHTASKSYDHRHAYLSGDDGLWYVRDRWAPLLAKGADVQPDQVHTNERWQLDYVTPSQRFISRQMWWTEHDIDEGGRMLNEAGKEIDEELFTKWGPRIVKQCLDWAALGFVLKKLRADHLSQESWDDKAYDPKETDGDGDVVMRKDPNKRKNPDVFEEMDEEDGRKVKYLMVYEIYSKLTLECKGANVNIKWFVARPGTEPYDTGGRPRQSLVQQLDQEKVVKLVSAKCNPHPRG